MIAVAHARMSEVDQAFSEAWLGSLDGLKLGTNLAGFVVDEGFVVGWDFDGSHVGNVQFKPDILSRWDRNCFLPISSVNQQSHKV